MFYHLGLHVSDLSHQRWLRIASSRVVEEMLRHATTRQTMHTYSSLLPNTRQETAERVDATLG